MRPLCTGILLLAVLTALVVAGCVPLTARPAPSPMRSVTPEAAILAAFEEVEAIRFMGSIGGEFELPAGGRTIRGPKEAFLRQRTGKEVLDSSFSSGCGDQALAFSYVLERMGVETRLVDGPELSLHSTITGFSGHVVVAVRDASRDQWFLADPTRSQILSRNWSFAEQLHSGRYYIGFVGAAEEFLSPTRLPLKQFYRETLDKVPIEVWNSTVIGLSFVVDDGLRTPGGGYVNPNIPDFLAAVAGAHERYGLTPERTVEIRLIRGGEDAVSSLEQAENGQWVCTLGLESAMSSSFLQYLERIIRKAVGSRAGVVPVGLAHLSTPGPPRQSHCRSGSYFHSVTGYRMSRLIPSLDAADPQLTAHDLVEHLAGIEVHEPGVVGGLGHEGGGPVLAALPR